jgi:putative salt-induced outer membrane protein YdiY
MRATRVVSLLVSGTALIAASTIARPASAQQDLPAGTQAAAPVTTGKTEVTADKFQGAVRVDPDEKDANELSLALGGVQSGGNSRLLAVTGATKYRLRREENQFRAALAGNYAESAAPGDDHFQTTVQNVQGLARYDLFLGDVTLFSALQGRTDRFQGLDLRMQLDPGVGYYFVNQKAELFWTEVGYDLLYDIRRDEARVQLDGDKNPIVGAPLLDKTRILHSARLFLGYENAFNAASKVSAGVEFLQGLSDTDVRRLNGDVALTTKLVGNLAISFSFSERYENRPLPGKRNLDTTTAASLVYTFR